MTPTKQRRGRYFEFDRVIRGVGRVRVSSGTANPTRFKLLDAMLLDLATSEQGRTVIRAMMAHQVTPLDVWPAYRAGTLDTLPMGPLARPLVATVAAWREAHRSEVSADTYRVRGELVRALGKYAPPDARLADLAHVLRDARAQMGRGSFRLARAYALACVRDLVGARHALYFDVKDIPVPKARAVPHLAGRSFWPTDVAAFLAHLAPARQRDVIGMLITGMNPKEYWGAWTLTPDRVHIDGTKRGGRVRDVPRAFPCALWPHGTLTRPSCAWRTFQRAFRVAARATGIPYTPYALRRSFAIWMEEAGIVRAHRTAYLGHGNHDIGDVYERQDVTRHLRADGEKLRAWLNAQLAGAPARAATGTAQDDGHVPVILPIHGRATARPALPHHEG